MGPQSPAFTASRILRGAAIPGLLFCALASAQVVDRIAVVVGNTAITESEVLREVRLTEFLNAEPLNLGPEERRAAADRLVDQQLIRNERNIGHYAEPSAAEAAEMMNKFCDEHYHGMTACRAAMARYGITEDELKQHLLWQIAAIRFTDQRFSAALPPQTDNSANRLQPGAAPPSDNAVEEQMDAWLKETRAGTRVVFKKEAFQ